VPRGASGELLGYGQSPVVNVANKPICQGVVELSGEHTLATQEDVLEAITAVGQVVAQSGRKIFFRLEEDDLWDLRGTLEELISVFESYGVEVDTESLKVTRVPGR
jgi:hypothetical protein